MGIADTRALTGHDDSWWVRNSNVNVMLESVCVSVCVSETFGAAKRVLFGVFSTTKIFLGRAFSFRIFLL